MKKYNRIDSLNAFMITIFAYLGMSFITSIFTLIFKIDTENLVILSTCIISLFGELSFLICLPFVSRGKNLKYALSLDNKKLDIKKIILCVCIALVALISFLSFNNLFLFFLEKLGLSSSINDSINISSLADVIFMLIFMAIIPAICEEISFRGVFANGLFRKDKKWFGIIVSATMFMIIHFNFSQSIYQFFFGCILCMVLYLTHSLYYTIIMHFTNNAFIIIATALQNSQTAQTFTTPIEFILPFVYLILGFIVIFFLFKILNKLCKDENDKIIIENVNENDNKNYFSNSDFYIKFTCFAIISIFMYIIFAISNSISG